MSRFEIIGKGKDSGRKRKRIYIARNATEAKTKAENDGTVVEKITKLPPDSPTEKQLAYAKDLRIPIPAETTKEDLTDLISRKLRKDKPSSKAHRVFAKKYGIETTDYIGKKELFDRIHSALIVPGKEKELLSWFIYRVYRELVNGIDNAQISSPDDPIITSIAEQFEKDEKIIKSIRRYKGSKLIWFGEWTSPDGIIFQGGSNRTIAYKQIASELRKKIKIPTNSTTTGKKSISEGIHDKNTSEETQGCLVSLLLIMAMPTSICAAFLWF